MKPFGCLIISLLITLFSHVPLHAGAQLYNGTLRIKETSGGACEGVQRTHRIVLAVKGSPERTEGYFRGEEISIGRFEGKPGGVMPLRYPYFDDLLGKGHTILLHLSENPPRAEVRDRHIEAHQQECNFDLAVLELEPPSAGAAADKAWQEMSGLFDVQIMRSEAVHHIKYRQTYMAIQLFDAALKKAEEIEGLSPLTTSLLLSLANSYARVDDIQSLQALYDRWKGKLAQSSVKPALAGYLAKSWSKQAKDAVRTEKYDRALELYGRALALDPNEKEYVGGVMVAHTKAGNYDKAVAFLQDQGRKHPDWKRDIADSIANVHFVRGRAEKKKGNRTVAQEAFRRAMELDPRSSQYLIEYARLQHREGLFDEARAILEDGARRFADGPSKNEILNAIDRMKITEYILARMH